MTLYLFTWNLNGVGNLEAATEALELATQHLVRRNAEEPWIACLQEVPANSWIAKARRSEPGNGSTPNIRVARVPLNALPRGIVLLHHPKLVVENQHADKDHEFFAVQFRQPTALTRVTVVGLHAKARNDMQAMQAQGGSRALLRHAINSLPWSSEHTVILGDFNSPIDDPQIWSWHCFYALSRGKLGLVDDERRGMRHAPLHVVEPENHPVLGTYFHKDSSGARYETVDFIVVDAGLYPSAHSKILTSLAGRELLQVESSEITLGDHLPVEGSVHLPGVSVA